MTERESIIAMMSPAEIEMFLAIGGSLPPCSIRKLRKRFPLFTEGVADDSIAYLQWSCAEERVEAPMKALVTEAA